MTSDRQLFQQLGDATSPKTLDDITGRKTHKRHQCDLQPSCAQCTHAWPLCIFYGPLGVKRNYTNSFYSAASAAQVIAYVPDPLGLSGDERGALVHWCLCTTAEQRTNGLLILMMAVQRWSRTARVHRGSETLPSCALTVYATPTTASFMVAFAKMLLCFVSDTERILPLLTDHSDWHWPVRRINMSCFQSSDVLVGQIPGLVEFSDIEL